MLKLVQYPHPTLKIKSQPVIEFNEKLVEITNDMIGVMQNENGIGLAANQVGIPLRIFIMNTDSNDKPYVFINPEISLLSPEQNQKTSYTEGCLSFPGISQEKQRFSEIKVKWQNLQGKFQEKIFSGLDSICIQHENDHINGITFIDDLSPLKKQFALKKMQKKNNTTKLKI
jgi:peptide deformylase